MSVYRKKKNAGFYHYDFCIDNRRFHGSTRETTKQRAEAVERLEREKAAALIKAEADATTAPLTLNRACGRYFLEVGAHGAAPKTVETHLKRLIDFLGKDKLLAEIDDADIAQLVAWRRTHTVAGRKGAPRIRAATINRSTIEPLQKIFNRAQEIWKLPLPDAPDFGSISPAAASTP